MRSDQFFDRVRSLVHGAATFWKCSIEVRKFFADRVVEFGIGKPWDVVKIRRNSRRFLDLVGDDNTRARFKVIADFIEETGLCEFVGSCLQVGPANLRADSETRDRYNLSFGKMLLPLNANLAQGCGHVVGSLRQ